LAEVLPIDSEYAQAEQNIRPAGADNLCIWHANLSLAARLTGRLRAAEVAAMRAIQYARQRWHLRDTDLNLFERGIGVYSLGVLLVDRGRFDDGREAFERALRIRRFEGKKQGQCYVYMLMAKAELQRGRVEDANSLADCAWDLVGDAGNQTDIIAVAAAQGASLMYLRRYDDAEEKLNFALGQARSVSLVPDYLFTSICLARLYYLRGQFDAATETLDHVWAAAQRGCYRLLQCDAKNLLADISAAIGNVEHAREAALEAYESAWCDGPPYSYHSGLTAAKSQLHRFGMREPELPPFDEGQFEPLPDIEVDPPDEFGAAREGH
jgi:ATP/maltotriose-dependent transcriptional regulator MalT